MSDKLYYFLILVIILNWQGSEFQLFSTSEAEIYQKMFLNMHYYSSDESMEMVKEGGYAYIYFRTNIESLVSAQYTDKLVNA